MDELCVSFVITYLIFASCTLFIIINERMTGPHGWMLEDEREKFIHNLDEKGCRLLPSRPRILLSWSALCPCAHFAVLLFLLLLLLLLLAFCWYIFRWSLLLLLHFKSSFFRHFAVHFWYLFVFDFGKFSGVASSLPLKEGHKGGRKEGRKEVFGVVDVCFGAFGKLTLVVGRWRRACRKDGESCDMLLIVRWFG